MTERDGRPQQSERLLRTVALTKSFGGIRAIDRLDLGVARGELRCLIGPNGAGKSTLFSLIAGIHRADAGRIFFKGEDITRLPPFRRVLRGICLKFQTTRVYRDLSISQNLLVALALRGPERRDGDTAGRLAWALATFGLDRDGDRPARELPHSHQQWLEICLALATDPDLLLLDEPTAGMTPDETALTADFVRRLNGQGTTILVVEHDMTFVRQIARAVTVLHYGRVIAEGPLAAIEANKDVRRIYLGEQ